jgi:hypothetical protein
VRDNWRSRAACRGMDSDLFYVHKESLRPPETLLKVCESCPVRAACLLEALIHREQGVWGGTTEKQRQLLRRHYLRRSCPSCTGEMVPLVDDDHQVCVACGLSWIVTKVRTSEGVRLLENHAERR